MKKLILYLILVISIFGCKKENTTENEPDEICVESSFSVTFDNHIKPVCIIEDKKSNILILGTVQGYVNVLKIDPYGNELWLKEVNEILGKPMNIIPADDGYFITSGTMQFAFTYGNPIPEIPVQTGFTLGSLNNYLPVYEVMENYIPVFSTPSNNKLYITKISESGSITAQTSYPDVNFSPGIQMVKTGEDSYLLAGFHFRGDGAEFEGFMNPAIVFPRNENSIYYLSMNSGGELTLINLFEGVLVFEWIDQILDREVTFDLIRNGNQYTLNLPNITYLLNSNAHNLGTYQPKYNFNGNRTFAIAYADENSNYFIGRVDFYDNPEPVYYEMKSDLNGNAIWFKEIDEFTDARLTPVEGGFYALINRSTGAVFYKYNSAGDVLWEYNPGKQPDCFISACNGGLIFAWYDPLTAKIAIVKMDANGN
jgi:hypothetical protein